MTEWKDGDRVKRISVCCSPDKWGSVGGTYTLKYESVGKFSLLELDNPEHIVDLACFEKSVDSEISLEKLYRGVLMQKRILEDYSAEFDQKYAVLTENINSAEVAYYAALDRIKRSI